ncbi:hypothetical protein NM208_g3522 [Fusarium decemcellulare]|uniref:Uncharacterized protein n=1 Tax=Fusarium decemcellulare TaxID=57161 RepID=A0ACC1SNZ4_9HYPO|nr:hypothetical protein NM208_g3522 [Fusarium decemcellulare]
MVNLLTFVLLAAPSAQALWLAVQDMDYGSNAGGTVFFSPYCQVGKGNDQAEALSKASSTIHGTILIAGGHCNHMSAQKTSQLGGFWDDYGTINYEDDNWHWYCSIPDGNRGSCDAGAGAPKKK